MDKPKKKQLDSSVGSDLIKSIVMPAELDILKDVAESVLDLSLSELTNNQAVLSIPVFGTILKIGNGLLDFRDRAWMNKIARFMLQLHTMSQDDKGKLIEQMNSNPVESQRVGAATLDILSSFARAEKADMLARVFKAHIAENLDDEYYLLLAEMIDRLYLYDLEQLADNKYYESQNLISAGVKQLFDMNTIYHEINKGMGYALSSGGLSTNVTFTPNYTKQGADLRRILDQYK